MGKPIRTNSKTKSFGTPTRLGHDASSFYERKLFDRQKKTARVKTLVWNCPNDVNVIHCHDARHMQHLPDESVHLMITSPPYNVGKDYDEDLSLEEYNNLLSKVMVETFRVLVDGGRACINIANVGRSPYVPLHYFIIKIAYNCGFSMRGEIIWDKGASAGTSCAWGSWRSASNPVLRDVHEYILVFSKNTFKRYPSQESSIGRDEFLECTKSVWRFPAVSAKRIGHPAPYPIELPSRLINLYSYIGDIVLDPFIGSGTTAVAALNTERKYVGYEIDSNYVKIAEERINVRKHQLMQTEMNL